MADNLEITLESTQFACEDVHVRRLEGIEAISKIFEFELEIIARREPLDVDTVIGASVSIVFSKHRLPVRKVHGMVAKLVDYLDPEGTTRSYKMVVTPRANRLALIDTLTVAVDTDVPGLVKAKLEQIGLESATTVSLSGTYEKRDFIVQYKETDLALVSRLTEHLGISFFFVHDDEEDRIVFTDHISGFKRVENTPFRLNDIKHGIFTIERHSAVLPNLFVVQDYNYRTPLVDLSGTHELAAGYAGGVVDYGSHVKTPGDALTLAKVRAEERHAQGSYYTGTSDVEQLSAGHIMAIDNHPRLDSGDLLIVSVRHKATQTTFNEGAPGEYANEFVAVPTKQGYRPRRDTPRPRVNGVVTGIVDAGLNPGSNEIARIDEHGRYFVRLLFDTTTEGRKASHPIRMSQPHAGPGYGQHFPLRPGVEVIVVFVDGDPDRPVIAGAVPNPVNPSPVVAADATVNRIRTQSGIVIEMHDR